MVFIRTFCSALTLSGAAFSVAQAQSLTEAQARAAITPFYESLNVAPGKDAEAVAKTIAGIGKGVPDLKWEFKEILVVGNRVIVRGEGSGTPAAEFMGVSHVGKSFKIMAIDIHTVENGKMVGKTYHVEDWMGAAHQLRAANR